MINIQATEMVKNIQDAYLEQLENVAWMDSITRQSAIDKLQSMHKFIAYPDWFRNTSYLQNKLKIVSVILHYRNILCFGQHRFEPRYNLILCTIRDFTRITHDITLIL